MAAQVSLQTVDALGAEIYISFNVALSGNYVTGGDPLNFTASGTLPVTQDPAYIGLVAQIVGSQGVQVDCWSMGGNLNQQYVPIVVKASGFFNLQTGCKLKTNAVGTFATEHSAAAYEGTITADIVTGFLIVTKV